MIKKITAFETNRALLYEPPQEQCARAGGTNRSAAIATKMWLKVREKIQQGSMQQMLGLLARMCVERNAIAAKTQFFLYICRYLEIFNVCAKQ